MRKPQLYLLFSLFPFAFLLANGDSINQDWYSAALENIKKQEYHITYSEESGLYQSPNRNNNLRFIYKNDGFIVSPRVTETYKNEENNPLAEKEKIEVIDDWNAEFIVWGYGRNGEVEKEFKGNKFIAEENTAYIEDNNMKVDYLNNEEGMRQNFTIYNKPKKEKGLLTLSLEIKTKEKLLIGADALVIKNKDATEYMKYNSLKIWDAEGTELRGWFESVSNNVTEETKKIQIVVNDENAKYPIIIDPLSNAANWSFLGEQSSSQFGFSVATAGDVNGDGYSDVIIGAPRYDGGETEEGKVYVFHGSASGLSTSPNWSIESNVENANLGYSVSTGGDVNGDGYSDVIIGAPNYTSTLNNEGAGFVYLGTSQGLLNNYNWFKVGGQENAQLGYSVSTAGNINDDGSYKYSDIIISAPYYSNSENYEGRVYLYNGSANGVMSSSSWIYESNQTDANLGLSVSTAGDVNGDGFSDIIVSAPYYSNSQNAEGIVYVFHGSNAGLNTTPNWSDEGDQVDAHFGLSVSTAGDFNGDGYSDIIIGSPDFNGSSISDAGIFSLHLGSVSGISSYYYKEGTETTGNLGKSVFTAGDINGDGYSDVVVGANTWTEGNYHGIGYVYFGSDIVSLNSPGWSKSESTLDDAFGDAISIAGDVNGDGYSDIIIGARKNDENGTKSGKCYLYYGGVTIDNIEDFVIEGNISNLRLGSAVSTAGDVNGDGYSDIIVAPYGSEVAEVYIYFGGPSMDSNADVTFVFTTGLRFSVSSAGDVNGDGYSDVIVGNSIEDKAYIFYGGTNMDNNADVILSGSYDFGREISTAGDVNGDGYSDIIIGVYEEDKAYIYLGGPNMDNIADLIMSEDADWGASGGRFGRSVSFAGDVNGDGYSDVVVSSDGRELAYIYFGGSIMDSVKDVTLEGDFGWTTSFGDEFTAGDINGDGFSDVVIYASNEGDGDSYICFGSAEMQPFFWLNTYIRGKNGIDSRLGYNLSIGDVNGDGFSDVIAGAPFWDNMDDPDTTYIYLGGLNIDNNPDFIFTTGEDDDSGKNASVAGDINGDGYSDIIIGAPYSSPNGINNAGKLLIFYGSNGKNLGSRIRQNNPSNGIRIAAGNLTQSTGSVEIGLKIKSPFGRADGRMAYEFRKNGESFSIGESIANGVGYDGTTTFEDLMLNPNGLGIFTTVNNLQSTYSDAYQWRARREFSLVNNPYQRYGPWKYYSAFDPIQPYAFRTRVYIPLFIIAQIKTFTEGPYDETNNNMFTTNFSNIPTTSPYEDGESVSSVPINSVDWIYVELRDKNDNTNILAGRSGFLNKDGSITNVNGTGPLNFQLPEDDYYIVIKHRNHLPIMSASPVHLSAN